MSSVAEIARDPAAGANVLEGLKQANLRLLALRWLLQEFDADAMPDYICFNVTPACNLQCPHCPIHGTPEKKLANNHHSRRMDREFLMELAGQSLPYARTFNLTLTGETLIIPDLDRILRALLPYGARLEVTTNATRLTARNIEQLLPVADQVQVSCDGASQRIFERLRFGARYQDFLRNVKLLTLTGAKVADLYHPRFSLSVAAMGSNLRELPLLVDLARFLGLAEIRIGPILVFFTGQEDEAIEHHQAAYNYYTRSAYELGQQTGVQVHCFQPAFPGIAEDPVVRRLPRMIVKDQLSEPDYSLLPPFESFVDQAALEEESSQLAEAIRSRGTDEGSIAVPEWATSETRRLEADFEALARRHAERLRALTIDHSQDRPYCIHLHERAFTGASGALLPCCIDTPTNLGNLRRNRVRDAWNGPPRVELIRKFMSDAPPDFCVGCSYRRWHPLGPLLERAFPEGVEAYLAALPVASHRPAWLTLAGRWFGRPF